jgi:hypothetical protein
VFTSLPDNLQETFGLVVPQAMACGLPVVGSDWDGYRDLIVDGETGLLVPTYMVGDATRDATSRLMNLNELGYDDFVAECSQAVTVDVRAAADAYARLFADPDLRRRMGQAGRERVLRHFTWEGVIAAYEALWHSQETQRRERAGAGGRSRPHAGPALFPAPEVSFGGFPTRLLDADSRVYSAGDSGQRLAPLLASPLTNYAGGVRSARSDVLRDVLNQAAGGCTIGQLDEALEKAGLLRAAGRATLAWLLKYGLLAVADAIQ